MSVRDFDGCGRPPHDLRTLRLASWFEGTTLILLLFAAVPLKHLAGYTIATTIAGPIHGLAFLFYVWAVSRAISQGGWSARDIARLIVAAFVPFGAYANRGLLQKRCGAASAGV